MKKSAKKKKPRASSGVAGAGRKVAPERKKELFAEEGGRPNSGKKLRLAQNPIATAYR